MFEKKFSDLTSRISAAAQSAMGNSNSNGVDDTKVHNLQSMGFSRIAATQALQATSGDVDRAAELLLVQQQEPQTSDNNPQQQQQQQQHSQMTGETEDEMLQRVMQESLSTEDQRRRNVAGAAERRAVTQKNFNRPVKTAASRKAGKAATQRVVATTGNKKTPPKIRSGSGGLTSFHPDVKVVPKLKDKSKEEQILRCADRLKNSPNAVDTLLRALAAVQKDPQNDKFRKINKTNPGYQRSLANVPGAEDMLHAVNFRPRGGDHPNTLVLLSSMVDPALLYLGISALEQTKQTREYQQGKQKLVFAKQLQEIQNSVNDSEAEALKRADHMSKCPTEPPAGRGALMQVSLGPDQTIRRRFDGDDTLSDVLHWLGGHGSVIPDHILSRTWSLVDLNRYPVVPIDCESHRARTLQYIGCWPSGKLEVVPSTEEWMQNKSLSAVGGEKRGSSRGLGSAPSDAL